MYIPDDTGKHFAPAPLSTRPFQERTNDRPRCSPDCSEQLKLRRVGGRGQQREAREAREAREKRKAGETQTRQSWEKPGKTVGGGGGAGNALADSSGAS